MLVKCYVVRINIVWFWIAFGLSLAPPNVQTRRNNGMDFASQPILRLINWLLFEHKKLYVHAHVGVDPRLLYFTPSILWWHVLIIQTLPTFFTHYRFISNFLESQDMKFKKFNHATLRINKCEGIHISTCMLSNKANLLCHMLAQPLQKSTRECSLNKMLEDNGESFTERTATWKFALNIRAPNSVASFDFDSYVLSQSPVIYFNMRTIILKSKWYQS